MSSSKSSSLKLRRKRRSLTAGGSPGVSKRGLALSLQCAKSPAAAVHLGEDAMRIKPASESFSSYAYDTASESALKKREYVRNAWSSGLIVTPDVQAVVVKTVDARKESFRATRAHARHEKLKAGAI